MKKIPAVAKNAEPVATPVPPDKTVDVFGCMAGSAEITGNVEAPVVSVRAWKDVR
jgi:hypothetical protein